jgi:hypothetical protein
MPLVSNRVKNILPMILFNRILDMFLFLDEIIANCYRYYIYLIELLFNLLYTLSQGYVNIIYSLIRLGFAFIHKLRALLKDMVFKYLQYLKSKLLIKIKDVINTVVLYIPIDALAHIYRKPLLFIKAVLYLISNIRSQGLYSLIQSILEESYPIHLEPPVSLKDRLDYIHLNYKLYIKYINFCFNNNVYLSYLNYKGFLYDSAQIENLSRRVEAIIRTKAVILERYRALYNRIHFYPCGHAGGNVAISLQVSLRYRATNPVNVVHRNCLLMAILFNQLNDSSE